MSGTHFPDFPALYDPPVDVVRLLRGVDPAADLLYFGWGTWYLVRHRPNREHIATAHRALVAGNRLLDRWGSGTEFKANPGAFRRLYGRFLFWTAVALGARPVAQYTRAFIRVLGWSAVIEDFRRAEWMYRTTSDGEVERLLTKDHDDGVVAAVARMRDEYAATTMVDYLSRQPHSVTSVSRSTGSSATRTIRTGPNGSTVLAS